MKRVDSGLGEGRPAPGGAAYERPAIEVVRLSARAMTDPGDNSAESPYATSSLDGEL